jgi:hypothetical protein
LTRGRLGWLGGAITVVVHHANHLLHLGHVPQVPRNRALLPRRFFEGLFALFSRREFVQVRFGRFHLHAEPLNEPLQHLRSES